MLPAVLHKGVHYFDTDYDKGMAWYRAHFPLQRTADQVERRLGVRPLTFESSPYYMFHPLAAERIERDLPGVKVLVLLRDPVERAYSAHAHELARGFETEDFETALELEDEPPRRRGRAADRRPAATAATRTSTTATCSAAATSTTSSAWRRSFGRDRMHVVDSHRFFTEPEPVYDDVLRVPRPAAHRLPGVRAAQRPAALPHGDRSCAERLEAHFAPYDERLASWLGHPVSWRRRSVGRNPLPT